MLDILFAFLLAFLFSFSVMPIVIRIAKRHHLVAESNDRASHDGVIPSYGGIGMFIGIVFVYLLCYPLSDFSHFRYLLSGLTIIFLVGAKDDLDPLSPISKLIGQLLAVSVFIGLSDIRITSLYGLFDIYEISYGFSIFLSLTFFLFLINSYNLIDGINGLASSLVILLTALLGTWFFFTGFYSYSLFAFTVCGATLAFLKYNVTPAKIFMGDTGSLVLGSICTILIIQFLEYNESLVNHPYKFDAAPAVALSLCILPVYDTLRVFALRIARGISPFTPDRNHIHHLMLKAGLSHMEATVSLLLINLLFILVTIQFSDASPFWLMISILSSAALLTLILSLVVTGKSRAVSRQVR